MDLTFLDFLTSVSTSSADGLSAIDGSLRISSGYVLVPLKPVPRNVTKELAEKCFHDSRLEWKLNLALKALTS